MKHHEDPAKLKAIKLWLEDDDRPPASNLSASINYPDLNKYAKLLVKIWNTPQEERPEKIVQCSVLAAKRGISRSCFRSVVNYILGKTDAFFASLATDNDSGMSFIHNIWLDLEKLADAQGVTDAHLKSISENLAAFSLENDRRELNTMLAAGALAYYTRRADAEGARIADQSSKVSICQPTLKALKCPNSDSSVTRYADGFQKLATTLKNDEPKNIFTSDFEKWWKDVLSQIQLRCSYGPEAFVDLIEVLKEFPGSKNVLSLKSEKKEPDAERPVQPTLEEKITQEVGNFSKMPLNKQKKLLNKKLESVYAISLFMNGVTLLDAANHEIPTGTLKNIQGLSRELKALLNPTVGENSGHPENPPNESPQLPIEDL